MAKPMPPVCGAPGTGVVAFVDPVQTGIRGVGLFTLPKVMSQLPLGSVTMCGLYVDGPIATFSNWKGPLAAVDVAWIICVPWLW